MYCERPIKGTCDKQCSNCKEYDPNIKRTSDKWLESYNVCILYPDGWDRKNYQYSFFEEKITKKEFEKRLMYSTVKMTKGN